MRIETQQELETAIARLAGRSPESLATFIVSLAQDSGPIGEHVRTFIVADDPTEFLTALEERIDSLQVSSGRDRQHRLGSEVGERLGYLLDAVETAVLPADPQGALALLVRLFESDGAAMESCGEHHDSVGSAFDRAGHLVARAAQFLPGDEVLAVLQRLIATDDYGTRRSLLAVVATVAGGR